MPMSTKKTRALYEAPGLSIEEMETDSILCASWTDGTIDDGNYNDFGTLGFNSAVQSTMIVDQFKG